MPHDTSRPGSAGADVANAASSGGIHAIRGFDYQATVILDLVLDHFDLHGASAYVRPEGLDDLDLGVVTGQVERRLYAQIKKPSEDAYGTPTSSLWTVTRAANELLPGTIERLSANTHCQSWILGDAVAPELQSLVKAGDAAFETAPAAYVEIVHLLAKDRSRVVEGLSASPKRQLERWRTSANSGGDLSQTASAFADAARAAGVSDDAVARYLAEQGRVNALLPDVLERTDLRSTYGSESDVAIRVCARLETRYQLRREVVSDTLFRNLRGFINDVSKMPGRRFDRDEFELEVRCVWPSMVPIKEPPPLPEWHILRGDLVSTITGTQPWNALEVVGISGSGKTSLAAEAIAHSREAEIDRITYYVEVRGDETMRNVLVGLAFHLRRRGIPEPFGLALRPTIPDEAMLADVAGVLGNLSQPILLVMDLVDGSCSQQFARDLAAFVRALTPGKLRLAVFGQQASLSELSPFDRERHSVERLDIRGFTFEEFVRLCARTYPDPDRAQLWDVYQHVTAGRAAGLFAKFAESLAGLESIELMQANAARPPDIFLQEAERRRFANLSHGARSAAEKLMCYALPFRPKDAAEVFPSENVGLAVRELLALGLLRKQDEDALEMHEIVRAGLEESIALATRKSAHTALAAWYAARNQITAQILHLDRAGTITVAHALARGLFLQGEHWDALVPYVARNHLLTGLEVAALLTKPEPPQQAYLLPDLLRQLGDASTAEALLDEVRRQAARFDKDYSWAWKMVEAILACDQERLHPLIEFALEKPDIPGGGMTRFEYVSTGARRFAVRIAPETLALFQRQQPEIKLRMLSVMLLDRRREVLRPAFEFLASYQAPPDWRRYGGSAPGSLPLRLSRKEDVVEFLAAIPLVQPAELITAKSALLGPFAGFAWSQRGLLRTHCADILAAATEDDTVLQNAIRVIAFLGDPRLARLCERLLARDGMVHTFGKLAPALNPATVDIQQYESRLLDPDRDLQDRVACLTILAAVGGDLGKLLRRLNEFDQKNYRLWKFLFLGASVTSPFEDAIPLLEEHLFSQETDKTPVFTPILSRLGELETPQSTAMLLRALSHSDPRVRFVAATTLSQHRTRGVLPSLLAQAAQETEPAVAQTEVIAAIASGPSASDDFSMVWPRALQPEVWRCVLAERLSDASSRDVLVRLATSAGTHWQVRRAAILAASRLPYEVALEEIASSVLAERSPFSVDQSNSLTPHSLLATLLQSEAGAMLPRFIAGRERFVGLFGSIFGAAWAEAMDGPLPTGEQAANWLFDRLSYHGWPRNGQAADLTLWELRIPLLHAAVLRGFRLCKRTDLLERQLGTAHSEWFLTRCLCELGKVGALNPKKFDEVKAAVAESTWSQSPFIAKVLNTLGGSHPAPDSLHSIDPAPAPQPDAKPARIGYVEVVLLLTGHDAPGDVQPPVVIEVATQQELEHLARLLAPHNDYSQAATTSTPSVAFMPGGAHAVGGANLKIVDNRAALRRTLRPAVAAANRFGCTISWHRALLLADQYDQYLQALLDCLVAQDDSNRFYAEWAEHEDILMPSLSNIQRAGQITSYIDDKFLPFLRRNAFAGTDELLEAMCMIAVRIESPRVDEVLASLLYRWTQRFDRKVQAPQHAQNYPLWRAFGALTRHKRFGLVPGWESRLLGVLQCNIMWYQKNQIVRVLEKSRCSYIPLESMLFRTENFEHYWSDEVDRLDEACQRLFGDIAPEGAARRGQVVGSG
jgi:hypothetical protein